jgi:hypothetical protein
MTMFTAMVETIAKKHELTSKKAVAKYLGVNPSTLGSALKSDTDESPYQGALLDPVKEAYQATRRSDRSTTRSARKNRLGRLRKSGDASWSAELEGEAIKITRTDPKNWVATNSHGDEVTKDATFKGIIAKLRELASKE